MAKARPEKTFADYVAIAISPILIMALAGSLAFFLLELAYSGQYSERMRWILFWFVFASVLVGRIAIEQGSEHAALFGVVLAAVTGLAAFRLAPDGAIAGLFVLAVIWWAVHRLTFDCTLIDDSVDASGEGLLQASGLDDAGENGTSQKTRPAWWRAVFGSADGSRAPGTWVVYFSVAALPLFGLGQLLIPAAESGRRQFAFFMLLIYVASALGLLLTTSFLGLRRYLRQRRLSMPGAMSVTWIVTGIVLIAGILGACFLLPRPDHSASPGDLLQQIADVRQKASEFAQRGNDSGEGEGKQAGKAPEDGQPQEQKPGEPQQNADQNPPPQDDAPRDPKGQQVRPGQGKPEDQQGEPKPGDQQAKDQPPAGEKQGADKPQEPGEQRNPPPQGQQDQQPPEGQKPPEDRQAPQQQDAEQQKPEQNPEQQAAEPPPEQPQSPMLDPSEWFSWMGEHWRIVLWIVFGLAGSIFLMRNWTACAEFLGRIWAEFLALFGARPAVGGDQEEMEAEAPIASRPFSEMSNPFATGDAQRMKPADVLRVTFAALQAWARESGRPRRSDQTPLEFVQQLQSAPVAAEAREVAQLYSRLTYAGQAPSRDDLDVMSRLWRRMEAVGASM